MIKIIVYTTPTCPWCVKTKTFLKQKNLSYTEKNVVEDELARNEMIRKSRQMGVPVLDVNGKVIIGFEPEAILAALPKSSSKKPKKSTKKSKKVKSKKMKKRT
ncbi:glutathione S-transferase N-terminal domain-containing protein [Candidatus Woesearchaeota archaeon]|nr:glutathione S-transferase N-terminal domain-containing protein [Candidatus Woesearchaeota archaeon]